MVKKVNVTCILFFLIFKIKFYWSTAAFPCGVSFFCAAERISSAHTDISSALDVLPV